MNNNELKIEIKKAKRKANAIIFLCSTILSVIIAFIFYYAFYHNYTVVLTSIADVKIPIPINLIEAVLLGIILFSFAFILLFRKSYILNNIPDQYTKKARKILEDEENELTEGDKASPAGLLVAIIAIIGVIFLSVNCFGTNEDSIRFSDSHNIVITTLKYSDCELFKLEGYYEDGAVMLYGDNAYGIVSKDGKRSYDFGNVSESRVDNLLSIYHHRYKEVKTIDDGINYIKEHNK